jgi:hypothetical protein
MSFYQPKKKKKKPSLKDKPKAKPNRQFKEKTPQQKAMLQKRMEERKEMYMTKDYRDFPDRKELK